MFNNTEDKQYLITYKSLPMDVAETTDPDLGQLGGGASHK